MVDLVLLKINIFFEEYTPSTSTYSMYKQFIKLIYQRFKMGIGQITSLNNQLISVSILITESNSQYVGISFPLPIYFFVTIHISDQ